MSITTTYRDNESTQRREAWQNGKLAYHWTRQEIDAMHTEAPETVWAWGDLPHWKRKRALSFNGEVRGASRLAGEASSAEGATSTVVLGVGDGNAEKL